VKLIFNQYMLSVTDNQRAVTAALGRLKDEIDQSDIRSTLSDDQLALNTNKVQVSEKGIRYYVRISQL